MMLDRNSSISQAPSVKLLRVVRVTVVLMSGGRGGVVDTGRLLQDVVDSGARDIGT